MSERSFERSYVVLLACLWQALEDVAQTIERDRHEDAADIQILRVELALLGDWIAAPTAAGLLTTFERHLVRDWIWAVRAALDKATVDHCTAHRVQTIYALQDDILDEVQACIRSRRALGRRTA